LLVFFGLTAESSATEDRSGAGAVGQANGGSADIVGSIRIDHVIYATRDLDAAAAWVERTLGLTPLPGGRHEGHGTHNRLVPLGGGYLELLAVADPEEAAGSMLGRALDAHLAENGDSLFRWCLAVDDIDAIAERLDTSVDAIARHGMTARLTGLAEAFRDPSLPFFIERDPGIPDPGASGDAGGITWVEVSGDPERLEAWLGDATLPLRVVPGPPRLQALGVGEREVRP
jgi:catechol 2,3-dioxygenase-like lactoylglutathione lyase family enzyme